MRSIWSISTQMSNYLSVRKKPKIQRVSKSSARSTSSNCQTQKSWPTTICSNLDSLKEMNKAPIFQMLSLIRIKNRLYSDSRRLSTPRSQVVSCLSSVIRKTFHPSELLKKHQNAFSICSWCRLSIMSKIWCQMATKKWVSHKASS